MPDVSSDKIKDFLSNPDNVNLIASLASSMSSGSGSGNAVSDNAGGEAEVHGGFSDKDDTDFAMPLPETPEKDAISQQMPSVPAISQGLSLLSGMADGDNRVALLKAIKPYINDEKKSRVDGLVKAISLASLINNYKDDLGRFLG